MRNEPRTPTKPRCAFYFFGPINPLRSNFGQTGHLSGETKLVEPTIERCFLAETPEPLIGDCAYDSDPLDAQISERFPVQLIGPHHPMGSRKATQDGGVRHPRRRRWKIERLLAWFHNFRRVVIR